MGFMVVSGNCPLVKFHVDRSGCSALFSKDRHPVVFEDYAYARRLANALMCLFPSD